MLNLPIYHTHKTQNTPLYCFHFIPFPDHLIIHNTPLFTRLKKRALQHDINKSNQSIPVLSTWHVSDSRPRITNPPDDLHTSKKRAHTRTVHASRKVHTHLPETMTTITGQQPHHPLHFCDICNSLSINRPHYSTHPTPFDRQHTTVVFYQTNIHERTEKYQFLVFILII